MGGGGAFGKLQQDYNQAKQSQAKLKPQTEQLVQATLQMGGQGGNAMNQMGNPMMGGMNQMGGMNPMGGVMPGGMRMA